MKIYTKYGCFENACKVFDEMHVRNLFTWSAMIGAVSRNKSLVEVVELFTDLGSPLGAGCSGSLGICLSAISRSLVLINPEST